MNETLDAEFWKGFVDNLRPLDTDQEERAIAALAERRSYPRNSSGLARGLPRGTHRNVSSGNDSIN